MELKLKVSDLSVSFRHSDSEVRALNSLSFELLKGQCLAIVGESGSGKSVTALNILKLMSIEYLDQKSEILYFDNGRQVSMLSSPEKLLYKIRGRKIAMVFQEPLSCLNPVMRCGAQVMEMLELHTSIPKENRKKRVLELFDSVRLPDVDRIYKAYPHEISGGQLQRVCIAMALAAGPDILICDEPTTALDVTVQKEIILLLKELVKIQELSLLFISHDLDVVNELCDSVLVLNKGYLVEEGPLPQTFMNPKTTYTRALLKCKPKFENKMFRLPQVKDFSIGDFKPVRRQDKRNLDETILDVQNLDVSYSLQSNSLFAKKKFVHAVKNVSFELKKNEILGIVGESGSGKSSIANVLAGLIPADRGIISYGVEGFRITPTSLRQNRKTRREIQLIFQDPYGSLNPSIRVGEAIREPIDYHKVVRNKSESYARTLELLEEVGLDESYYSRYPHQLSGGQRQRICIARALSTEPALLLCDESVSALDVSVQAQILNLLDKLRHERSLSMIFISHDIAVVHYLCDRIMVMKDGYCVETGQADDIVLHPKEPYTHKLLSSAPGFQLSF